MLLEFFIISAEGSQMNGHGSWIGATDQAEEGTWRWYGTNDVIIYQRWGTAFSNKQGRDCATLNHDSLMWEPRFCRKIMNALCEYHV